MPLTFSPVAAVYDRSRDAVRVIALDGQRLIPCAIRGEALRQLDGLASDCDGCRLIGAYHRHADDLQALASAKYDAKQYGARDGLMLEPGDVITALPDRAAGAEVVLRQAS